MTCKNCEFPIRKVWPPLGNVPKFIDIDSQNWMSLSKCGSCKTLWVSVPYEPYASFKYSVVWNKNETQWKNEISKDEGKELHNWHKSELLKYRDTLSQQDIEAIQTHRERSSGRDPYNET